MHLILFSLLLLFIVWELYKRYFPIIGIHCEDVLKVDLTNIEVIDVRDYNISYKDVIENSINIPVAYLARYCYEIPDKKVHVVASTRLEKNVAIRILRRKGFLVSGYSIIDSRKFCCKYAVT
jgi:rhodanese-related sulfurtransferase